MPSCRLAEEHSPLFRALPGPSWRGRALKAGIPAAAVGEVERLEAPVPPVSPGLRPLWPEGQG